MTWVLRTDMRVDRPLGPVWALFSEAANLEAITPPELHFRILTPTPIEMRRGARIEYRIRLFGVPFHWLTEITCWEPGVRFVDEQIAGPFRRWVHQHRFEVIGDGATRIRDEVHYDLPLGRLGGLAHPIVRSRLDRIFDYREVRVRELLEGTLHPDDPDWPGRSRRADRPGRRPEEVGA
jgi:ligand-binding SRPBCC domain-containing protein